MSEWQSDAWLDSRCGRRRLGVRCEDDGVIGVVTDDDDVLWLCAEHFAELQRKTVAR
jgi:hypothetical protein